MVWGNAGVPLLPFNSQMALHCAETQVAASSWSPVHLSVKPVKFERVEKESNSVKAHARLRSY